MKYGLIISSYLAFPDVIGFLSYKNSYFLNL